MQLLFFTEARLYRAKNGNYCSTNVGFSYKLFKRYFEVFDKVSVVARTLDDSRSIIDNTEDIHVSGRRVEVLPLPYYIGPYQYVIKKKIILKYIKEYIDSNPSAAVICRVPGIIGTGASCYLIKKHRPYGLEVVGDPSDVFAPGAYKHPLRSLFRVLITKSQKQLVKEAAASIYVTKEYLQSRYPPGKDRFSTHASNVMLPPEAFAAHAKRINDHPPYKVVAIGSLAAMYKAPDIAIEVISILKKRGKLVELIWIGDGKHRLEMIDSAKKAGVSDRVHFIGNIGSTEQVKRYLDTSDIFLLPSRAEGLPRALIEAMARGCPCIASNIGGIPELLDKMALVPVNNSEIIADKIEAFLSNPVMAKKQADRNLRVAKDYELNQLELKRILFYKKIKNLTGR